MARTDKRKAETPAGDRSVKSNVNTSWKEDAHAQASWKPAAQQVLYRLARADKRKAETPAGDRSVKFPKASDVPVACAPRPEEP